MDRRKPLSSLARCSAPMRGVRLYFCLAILMVPLAVLGWGGRMHMDISRAAAQNVPDEMAAWRDYANLLARLSIHPDLWKGEDNDEGPRHYIEPEHIKGVVFTNLPKALSALHDITGKMPPEKTGVAPWVILKTQRRLVEAMAQTNWVEATRLAGALGHYVADTHQPLHCTAYFDGKTPPSRGVHLRWEVEMPKPRWNRSMLKPRGAEYQADVWCFMLAWMEAANARHSIILEADRTARHETNAGVESEAYFQRMWEESKDVMMEQASLSVTDLSSLWYTAWVDAGKPPIPPPPDSVSEFSIHRPPPQTSVEKEAQDSVPWIFLVVLGLITVVVVALSACRRPRTAGLSPGTQQKP